MSEPRFQGEAPGAEAPASSGLAPSPSPRSSAQLDQIASACAPVRRRGELCCVVSFSSTHDAMRAELACMQAKVPGRIIPTPVQIHADCGLAWKMPPEARPAFEAAVAGAAEPAGYHELEL